MKNRILTFIIGVLTGAIIMTLIFLIFNKQNDNTNIGKFPLNENGEMKRPNGNIGESPERPNGNMGEPPERPNGNMGEPPERPNGNMGEPPERPNGNMQMPPQ